jgi:hypothetical protein
VLHRRPLEEEPLAEIVLEIEGETDESVEISRAPGNDAYPM